jgi:hypothetical protein
VFARPAGALHAFFTLGETAFKMIRWGRYQRCPKFAPPASVEAYEGAARTARFASTARAARRISPSRPERCFASHKLPLRGYLAAIAMFGNEVKGKSALALSRDLGLSYKSAIVPAGCAKRWLRK